MNPPDSSAVARMTPITIVFDFDRTIIDGDSDNWVVTQMGLTQLFNELYSSMPWNSLMDTLMGELQYRGRTTKEIAECLKGVVLHPQIIAAIKSAQAVGDQNTPTFVDGVERLRILPYHDLNSSPHGCNLCPSNMCKGLVMDQIRALKSEKQKFIYIGDGRGDYCPTLRLREEDHVLPRRNYPLWERICSNQTLVKAQIHAWSDGEELEKILRDLRGRLLEGNVDARESKSSMSKNIDACGCRCLRM